MSDTPEKKSAVKRGLGVVKLAFGGAAGLATGVIGVYATALVDKVAKPPKPLANFAATADGLTVTCDNHASGQSGWWDFGDGGPLEAFDPEQKQVTHTYAKAGSYDVKLVVRNFLNEENDRSVGVDVTNTPKSGEGPSVATLTVEPVGGNTAPATFRVKCEAKNAQTLLLDNGTTVQPAELIPAGNGSFERLVVYEKPGEFAYQVYAQSGQKVAKQWKVVSVKTPSAGALSVIASVTDTGTQVERRPRPVTVVVQVPAKPSGGWERVVTSDAGFTLADAKLGAITSKAVKNVTVTVAADKKSAKVTGEWTGTTDATNVKSGGSDPMIPLTLTEEKATAYTGKPQPMAAQLAFAGSFSPLSDDWGSGPQTATLRLPDAPPGVVKVVRKIAVDIKEMTVASGRLTDTSVMRLPDLTKPVEEYQVQLSNGEKRACRLERTAANELRVTVRPIPANLRAGK